MPEPQTLGHGLIAPCVTGLFLRSKKWAPKRPFLSCFKLGSELHGYASIDRTSHAWNSVTIWPTSSRRHGPALPHIRPTQRKVIEPVEDILYAHIKPGLFPRIAAAQVQQAVACGFKLVANLRHVILGIHQLDFCGVGPAAQALHHSQ